MEDRKKKPKKRARPETAGHVPLNPTYVQSASLRRPERLKKSKNEININLEISAPPRTKRPRQSNEENQTLDIEENQAPKRRRTLKSNGTKEAPINKSVKINLRKGIPLNTSLDTLNAYGIYNSDSEIQSFIGNIGDSNPRRDKLALRNRQMDLEEPEVEANKAPEILPDILVSELSPMQLAELHNVQTLEELDTLLEKYTGEDPTMFIACTIYQLKFREDVSEEQIEEAILFKNIFTHKNQQQHRQEVATKPPTRLTVPTKPKKVFENATEIAKTLKNIKENDYGKSLDDHLKQLEQELTSENSETPQQLSTLSDYANTLYSQYRDIMTLPWEKTPPKKSQTKDTFIQKLSAIYLAQQGLENDIFQNIQIDHPLYRWLEGHELYEEGDIISPLALYSTSTGPKSGEAFGGTEDRTLFIFRNHHSGRLIQLLTGTKNWYQREVLFPAYSQFIVIAKTLKTRASGHSDLWYVLDEIKEPLLSLGKNAKGIGSMRNDEGYALEDEFATNTLVDKKHRELFQNKQPTLEELEKAGIEGIEEDNVGKLAVHNLYGQATHDTWKQLLKEPISRTNILTMDTFKKYYEKFTNKEASFRTDEVGWGDDTFHTLTQTQLNALEAHNLLAYPVIITGKMTEQYLQWLSKSRRKQFENLDGTKSSRDEYIKMVKGHQKNDKSIPITPELYLAFSKSIKSMPETQYEVTHGEPNELEKEIVIILNKTSVALEQALTMYISGLIDKELYAKKVTKYATGLQQDIVSIHPFSDANGRLSRIMMYKVLQAYMPSDAHQIFPVIDDPGMDLLSTKEEWHKLLYPAHSSIATTSTSTSTLNAQTITTANSINIFPPTYHMTSNFESDDQYGDKLSITQKKYGEELDDYDVGELGNYNGGEYDNVEEKVIDLNTWNEADQHDFKKGTRIRIMHNQPDISERVYELIEDYWGGGGNQLTTDTYLKRIQ